MNNIYFGGNLLSKLIPQIDIYNKDTMLLDLFIETGITVEDAEKLKEIFKNAHVDFKSHIRPLCDMRTWKIDITKCGGYISIPPSQAREALNALFKAKIISAEERENSQKLINHCEGRIKYQSDVCDEITTSQEEIFKKMFVELYIDSLNNGITDLESMRECLDCIFNREFAFQREPTLEMADEIFKERKIDVKSELKKEVWEAICTLQKLYHGEANLESTFLKTGDGIPNLEFQKKIIVSYVKKLILEKFKVSEDGDFWKRLRLP